MVTGSSGSFVNKSEIKQCAAYNVDFDCLMCIIESELQVVEALVIYVVMSVLCV